ncbi:MAG: hypothetical protein WC686_00570 [Candidatus Shapirobacteria bacterium]|jgi:hypothetical protein
MPKLFHLSAAFLFFYSSLGLFWAPLSPLLAKTLIVSWMLIFVWLLAFGIYLEIQNLRQKKYPIYTAISLFITFAIILSNIANGKYLYGEIAQETTCLFNHLSASSDLGFNQTCLFGYPARQFIFSSLPSFFGRSLFLLNVGPFLYFIIGLTLFIAGIRYFIDDSRTGDLLTALFIWLLPHSPHFFHLVFSFEQALFPLCFTLALLGLFFAFQKAKDVFPLFGFGQVILLLTYSYTPSLSVVLLSFVALFYFLFLYRHQFKITISLSLIIIFCAINLLSSVTLRQDLNRQNSSANPSVLSASLTVLSHVFFQSQGKNFVDPQIQAWFILATAAPLLLVYGFRHFVISLWVVATILLSALSPGYASPPIDFALHRAIIIIPVLYAQNLIALIHRKTICQILPLLQLLLLLLAVSGVSKYLSYTQGQSISPYYSVITWLAEKNIIVPKTPATVYFASGINSGITSLRDFMPYFYPNVSTHSLDHQFCQLSQTIPPGIYIFPSDFSCGLLNDSPAFRQEQYLEPSTHQVYLIKNISQVF